MTTTTATAENHTPQLAASWKTSENHTEDDGADGGGKTYVNPVVLPYFNAGLYHPHTQEN